MAGSSRHELVAFDMDGQELWRRAEDDMRVEALTADHVEFSDSFDRRLTGAEAR